MIHLPPVNALQGTPETMPAPLQRRYNVPAAMILLIILSPKDPTGCCWLMPAAGLSIFPQEIAPF
jgi:hypothetical protein